jgi:hypothetical protein
MAKKRPRITDEQVGEMLRLKREGKRDTAIAKVLGIHRQTVGRYLKRRRNDILADEARKQVLIEELRNHFRELVDFARTHMKRRLDASPSESPVPPGMPMLMPVHTPVVGVLGLPDAEVEMPGSISVAGFLGLPGRGSLRHTVCHWARMYDPSPKERHLTQSLREHTKDSDLWAHWDSLRKEVSEYETITLALLQWVREKTEAERWRRIDPEYMDSIRRWLFGNILLKTSGTDYERQEAKGRELISSVTGEVIARAADAASASALHEYLNEMLEEAEQRPESTTLRSATSQLKEKQSRLEGIVLKIGSALDGIELMHAFPGRCHLCPV